jgi:hypothetical protein
MKDNDDIPGGECMKHYAIRWTFAALATCSTTQIYAAQPPVNLGLSSFVDGKAGPCFFFQQFVQTYNTDQFVDAQGHRNASDDRRLNVTALASDFVYLSKTKVLGAYIGAEAIVTIVNANPSFVPKQAINNGVGDPTFLFLLQWPEEQLFGHAYWQRLALPVTMPWGSYRRNAAVNPGSHSQNSDPYYSFTFFINPQWEFSGRLMYMMPGKNHEPNPDVAQYSTQYGQAYHANLSISRALNDHWRVGIASYLLRQVSLDRRDGVAVPNSRISTNGLGPGILYRYKNTSLYANVYKEFSARNTSEGTRVVLRFSQVF